MIKNLFIPDSVKGYYVFPLRIIGFDVGKTSVKAAQIVCKGREIVIEKFYEQPIISANPNDYADRASEAIRIIIDQIGSYDRVVSALSSSFVIFKELRLPFMGIDTIKKVIAYEVEPLLPFSINDAIVDCIVTREIPEDKSSEILVAAVQNQYLAQHLALFEAAGVDPDTVTIDLFALYGLYSMIPGYAEQKGAIVLLEIEPSSTRIAYLYDGQLRFIRTLSKGLQDHARLLSDAAKITPEQAYEQIMRFGVEQDQNNQYVESSRSTFSDFFSNILFTLQSFVSQTKPPQSLQKIVLLGQSATIKGLPELITDLTHVPTQVFSINPLIHNGFGISAKTAVPQTNIISLAAALPNTRTANFNLRQKNFARSERRTLLYNIITAGLLTLLVLGGLIGNAIWQVSRLKKEVYRSEQESVDALKDHFKKIPDDATTLEEVLDASKSIVSQDERLWSAFSATSRAHFLQYLLELTTKLDKAALGLDVEKITMTADTIVLKAQVKGYDELKALERDLEQSKLFSFVEKVNDPKFTMTIRVAKTRERQ